MSSPNATAPQHEAAMEIYQQGETWKETDDGLVFDHIKTIVNRRADDEFFYAKSALCKDQRYPSDITGLDLIHIPLDHIWPLYDPTFTRAPEPLPSNCYLKRLALVHYGNGSDDSRYGEEILTEVKACEVLRLHPHPNIAQYLGCSVKDGRIRGLWFTKYSITLGKMLKDGTPFDRSRCLQEIEAGPRHMHELNLIHNDLHPYNIMMDGDRFVIIDFDSGQQEGSELGLKGGTEGWSLDGEDYARREHDMYSLSKIQEALLIEEIENGEESESEEESEVGSRDPMG